MRHHMIISLLCVIACNAAFAQQFIQDGETLLYKGRAAKEKTGIPITVVCSGASSCSNDKDGRFSLVFNKAKAGDLASPISIRISNDSYVWFNQSASEQWVLTNDIKLPIVLCRADYIEKIRRDYTNSYVHWLERRYKASIDSIRSKKLDIETINKELAALKERHKRDLDDIRLRSIEFAYVDESEIDSLEYEMRQCELNSDIDGAIRIANQMNLGKKLDDMSKNVDIFHREARKSLDALYRMTEITSRHIRNCEASLADNDSIKGLYNMVFPHYEKLLHVYDPQNMDGFRCQPEFYDALKSKYSQLLVSYCRTYWDMIDHLDKLNRAAELDNVDALWDRAQVLYSKGDERSQSMAQKDYQRIIELYSAKHVLPTQFGWEEVSIEDVYEAMERKPDISTAIDGDTVQFHIMSDNAVSMVSWHRNPKNTGKLKVPSSIKHDGKKYTVTKIGTWAFFGSGTIAINADVELPNTITHTGNNAFYDITGSVNLPKSLKYIGGIDLGVIADKDGNVDIPDGVEKLAIDYAGIFPDNRPYSIKLPKALQEIRFDVGVGNLLFKDISLSPENQNFRIINGVLYSRDLSEIYWGTISRTTPVNLYISRKLDITESTVDELPWWRDTGKDISDLIAGFEVEDGHASLCTFDGNLFDKNSGCMLLRSCKQECTMPEYFKYFSYRAAKPFRKVTFPDNADPSGIAAYINLLIDSDTWHGTEESGYHAGEIEYLGIAKKFDSPNIYAQAQEFLDEIISEHPQLLAPYLTKGLLCMGDSDLSGLYDLMEEMDRQKLNDTGSYKILSDSLTAFENRFNNLLARADSLFNEGKYDKARSCYRDLADFYARAVNDTDRFNYAWLKNREAVCLSFIDDIDSPTLVEAIYDRIIPIIEDLLSKDPDNTDYRQLAVLIYRNSLSCYLNSTDSQKVTKAKDYLKKAIELMPTDIETYNRLGILYYQTGNTDEAHKLLDEMNQKFTAKEVESTDFYGYMME